MLESEMVLTVVSLLQFPLLSLIEHGAWQMPKFFYTVEYKEEVFSFYKNA